MIEALTATPLVNTLTIAMDTCTCIVTPISAGDYFNILKGDSLALKPDYLFLHSLILHFEKESASFYHPQLYAGLKTLFGESTTTYDDYKASFGYPFHIQVTRQHSSSEYSVNFTDIKGGLSFYFRKLLVSAKEKEAYKDFNQDYLHKPFEDDFSTREMQYVMNWFMGYIQGFMEIVGNSYQEDYARSLEYCTMIYGFKDKRFFLNEYDDYEDFERAKALFQEQKMIPFNVIKAPTSS